jgi:CRISPR-associated endoribonuclease Cas6/Csy4 subtype I-F
MHYLELTIKCQSYSQSKVVSDIFSAFHGAMRCYGEHSPIGIAFPQLKQHINPQMTSFGNVVRFFGHKADLSMWLSNGIFEKFEDDSSVDVSRILPVPETTSFVRYARDSTVHRAQRNNRAHLINCYYPTANLKSSTNGRQYSVGVKMIAVNEASDGEFNAFGLSNGDNPGTVPFF